MKNIFKMMGIALLACSMIMVSCKKDDDNNESGQGGQGGGGGTTGNTEINITWDGAAQTLGYKYLDIEDSAFSTQTEVGKAYMFEAARGLNGEDYELPAFIVYILRAGSTVGHASQWQFRTEQGQTTSGNYYYPTEAYIDGAFELQGEVMGDWQMDSITSAQNLAFDATNMTMSASLNIAMYDFVSFYPPYVQWNQSYSEIVAAYQAGEMTEDEALAAINALPTPTYTYKDMTFVINNYKVSK